MLMIMTKFKIKLNNDEFHILETVLAQTIGKRKCYGLDTKEYIKLLLNIDKQISKQLEDGNSK